MLKVDAQKFGNIGILRLEGRIVVGRGIDILRDAVTSQRDVSTVILDLARVSTIDAAGLGTMLKLRSQLEAKGIEFRLTNVARLVRQVLTITRLDSVFKVSETKAVPPKPTPRQAVQACC